MDISALLAPTQTEGDLSIPFSLTSPQQNFRLFELPPELLASIESAKEFAITHPNGPPLAILLISRPLKSSDDRKYRKLKDRERLHLCTEDRVWAVRQVSTSNNVYITRPTNIQSGEETEEEEEGVGDAMDLDGVASKPGSGVTAIAQLDSVLELVPIQTTVSNIISDMREMFPTYDSTNDILRNASDTSGCCLRLYTDIPAPIMLIRSSESLLSVFDLCKPPLYHQAYIPSRAALLSTWEKLVEAAALTNVRLDLPFNTKQLVNAMMPLEDDTSLSASPDKEQTPESLDPYKAMAKVLLVKTLPAFGMIEAPDPSTATQMRLEETVLRPKETTVWVGKLLLKALKSRSAGMNLEEHHERWQALVPEKWWELCQPEALKGYEIMKFPTTAGMQEGEPARIRWTPKGASVGLEATSSNESGYTKHEGESEGVAGEGKKRNIWHEKAAKQREEQAKKVKR